MLGWTIGSFVGRIVLPPTILFLLIAFGLWHWNKKWGLWLASASLALLYALSTPIVAYMLWDSITEPYAALTAAQVAALPKQRAIIVILAGGKATALEYAAGETAGPLTVQRARYGVWLAKATGLPLAIAGGKPSGGKLSEAELARSFVETELKHEVTLIEDKSLDTRQSAVYLAKPLQAMTIDTVVLVTDARHMPRASQAFASEGFNVISAPMAVTARGL